MGGEKWKEDLLFETSNPEITGKETSLKIFLIVRF